MDSTELIGNVEARYKELDHKGWDWRSFYNGWVEGRVDMLARIHKILREQQVNGLFNLKQEDDLKKAESERDKWKSLAVEAMDTLQLISVTGPTFDATADEWMHAIISKEAFEKLQEALEAQEAQNEQA